MKKQKDWQEWGEQNLHQVLMEARNLPLLKKKGPQNDFWQVDMNVVSSPVMKQLNTKYRQKNSVTDVLSFPSPLFFFQQGHLGELIICLPVLKKQAKELGHSPEQEFLVLLIHGVLHLLGFDHELGEKEALQMALWEGRLLKKLQTSVDGVFLQGLIERSKSDKDHV